MLYLRIENVTFYRPLKKSTLSQTKKKEEIWTILKAFADDKLHVNLLMSSVLDIIENIVGKVETNTFFFSHIVRVVKLERMLVKGLINHYPTNPTTSLLPRA